MIRVLSILIVVATVSASVAKDQVTTSSENDHAFPDSQNNVAERIHASIRSGSHPTKTPDATVDDDHFPVHEAVADFRPQISLRVHVFLWGMTLTSILFLVQGATEVCQWLWSWSKPIPILPFLIENLYRGALATSMRDDFGEVCDFHFLLMCNLSAIATCIVGLVAVVATLRHLRSPTPLTIALLITASFLFPVTAFAQRNVRPCYRIASPVEYYEHETPIKIYGHPTPPARRVSISKRVHGVPEPPAAPDAPDQGHVDNSHAIDSLNPPWCFPKAVALPFRGGRDLPFDGFRGCSPFVCASLLDGHGLELNETTVRELEALDPERDGTPQSAVVSYLKNFFDLEEQRTSTTDALVAHLDAGFPAFVIIRHGESFHSCLVIGYQSGSNSGIVSWTLTDNGVAGGEVPHDTFLKMWDCSPIIKNYALFIRPKSADSLTTERFQKNVQLPTLTLSKNVTHNHNGVSLLASLFQASGCDIDQTVIDHIRRELDPEGNGATPSEWAEYLEPFFDVRHQGETSATELVQHLDAGLPAFVVLTMNNWPIHWVIVTGYRSDELGNPVSWSVLDISRRAQLSHEEFLAAWQDQDYYQNHALFLTPNRSKAQPTFPQQ